MANPTGATSGANAGSRVHLDEQQSHFVLHCVFPEHDRCLEWGKDARQGKCYYVGQLPNWKLNCILLILILMPSAIEEYNKSLECVDL